jgi:hypothetical protein
MMKKRTVLPFVLLIALVMAGCDGGNSAAQAGPQAWIDTPLDGSAVPLAPLEVISHAADLAGIDAVELSVDGVVVDTAAVDETATLVTVHQTWTPPGAGNYTLQVRAQNTVGTWGEDAQAVVTVGGAEETPAPEETPPPPEETPPPEAETPPPVETTGCPAESDGCTSDEECWDISVGRDIDWHCRDCMCYPPCIVNGVCEPDLGEHVGNCAEDCAVCGDGIFSPAGGETCELGAGIVCGIGQICNAQCQCEECQPHCEVDANCSSYCEGGTCQNHCCVCP